MAIRYNSPSRTAVFLIVSALVLLALALGHTPRRLAQLYVLFLPGLAALFLPLRHPWLMSLRTAFLVVWSSSFVLDGLARAYFRLMYDAAPDSAMVLNALANTGQRESLEYLAMQAPLVATVIAAAVVLTLAIVWLIRVPQPGAHPNRASRAVKVGRTAVVILLATAVGAYATPAWRRLHPALFWSDWSRDIVDVRGDLRERLDERQAAIAHVRTHNPVVSVDGSSTVVLVISDSINRDNLSLYGYPRPTTPQLQRKKAELGRDMVVVRNAWANHASTVPALNDIFAFGEGEYGSLHHALAMADAAGYRIWWISNHDDYGIEAMHARFADDVHMLSRSPGRSSTPFDDVVLPIVRQAARDAARRKLIVVHLLGSHPHYRYRYPSREGQFTATYDQTDAQLDSRDISYWVRRLRDEYDESLVYHDKVVADLLSITTDGRDDYRAFFYLSDHGQEVGHEIDKAGHSMTTAAGFRIPAIIWQNRPRQPLPLDIEQRPFRTDWSGWTLMSLLGVTFDGLDRERDILDARYSWQPPDISAPVSSFVDAVVAGPDNPMPTPP